MLSEANVDEIPLRRPQPLSRKGTEDERLQIELLNPNLSTGGECLGSLHRSDAHGETSTGAALFPTITPITAPI